jgi:hypothetical protein
MRVLAAVLALIAALLLVSGAAGAPAATCAATPGIVGFGSLERFPGPREL